MLKFERGARAARRKIWALDFCRVRKFEGGARHINSFRLVGECVLEPAAVHGRVFLNTGRNWRTGFTISLRPTVARPFRLEGTGRLGYEDTRVRGRLKFANDPKIRATHPEQMEVLK